MIHGCLLGRVALVVILRFAGMERDESQPTSCQWLMPSCSDQGNENWWGERDFSIGAGYQSDAISEGQLFKLSLRKIIGLKVGCLNQSLRNRSLCYSVV
jgi:hypothetical protein